MGEDEARAAGFEPTVVGSLAGRPRLVARGGDVAQTTGGDTEQAARDLVAAGVELILFAGGDGTARNIFNAVAHGVPVVGIPAGVKIHSAVYANTPAAAGDLVARFLGDHAAAAPLREAEVMDIDEEAFRDNRVSARLYGYLLVPYARALIQSAKAGGVAGDAAELESIAVEVVNGMEPGVVYLLGPGTTTRAIAERLGVAKTLLGVDAVIDRAAAGSDLNEHDILELLEARGRGAPAGSGTPVGSRTPAGGGTPGESDASPGAARARILVTVIGGQGHILGRGNQQFSPAVIRRVGRDAVTVVASQTKLLSLGGGPLLVDTGDEELDRSLAGYTRVVTALGRMTMYRVAAVSE